MSFADKFLGAMSLDSRVISTRTSKCKPSFRDEEREGLRQERLRARERAAGEAKEVEEAIQSFEERNGLDVVRRKAREEQRREMERRRMGQERKLQQGARSLASTAAGRSALRQVYADQMAPSQVAKLWQAGRSDTRLAGLRASARALHTMGMLEHGRTPPDPSTIPGASSQEEALARLRVMVAHRGREKGGEEDGGAPVMEGGHSSSAIPSSPEEQRRVLVLRRLHGGVLPVEGEVAQQRRSLDEYPFPGSGQGSRSQSLPPRMPINNKRNGQGKTGRPENAATHTRMHLMTGSDRPVQQRPWRPPTSGNTQSTGFVGLEFQESAVDHVPFNHKLRVRTPSRKTAIEPIFGNELHIPEDPKTRPTGTFRNVMSPSGITQDKFTNKWHRTNALKAYQLRARRDLQDQLDKEQEIRDRRAEELRKIREKNEQRFLEAVKRGEPYALHKLAEIESFDRMLQEERRIIVDPDTLEATCKGKLSRDVSPLSPAIKRQLGQRAPPAPRQQQQHPKEPLLPSSSSPAPPPPPPAGATAASAASLLSSHASSQASSSTTSSSPPAVLSRQVSGTLVCDGPHRPYSLYSVVHPVGVSEDRSSPLCKGSSGRNDRRSSSQSLTPAQKQQQQQGRGNNHRRQHSVSFGGVVDIPPASAAAPPTKQGPSSDEAAEAATQGTTVVMRRIPSRERTWRKTPSCDALDLSEVWELAERHRQQQQRSPQRGSPSPPLHATMAGMLREEHSMREHDEDMEFGKDSLWNFELTQSGMM